MPDKDVAVSAQFEPITYSITYVLSDTNLTGNNPDAYTVENAVELADLYKEATRFADGTDTTPRASTALTSRITE